MPRLRAAVNDFILTAAWCAVSSLLGTTSNYLSKTMSFNWDVVFLGQLIAFLIVFIEVGNRMGGALFNPAIGQVLGAIAGPYIVWLVSPQWLMDDIFRPRVLDEASLLEGIACEGISGFLANLIGLHAMDYGGVIGYWGPFAVTCVLVKIGQVYSGPIMNPAYALAWNFYHGTHDEAEHVLVYWVAPFVGSLAAGLAYKATHTKGKKKKL